MGPRCSEAGSLVSTWVWLPGFHMPCPSKKRFNSDGFISVYEKHILDRYEYWRVRNPYSFKARRLQVVVVVEHGATGLVYVRDVMFTRLVHDSLPDWFNITAEVHRANRLLYSSVMLRQFWEYLKRCLILALILELRNVLSMHCMKSFKWLWKTS